MLTKAANDWWTEEYGFFGNFYMEGDNSVEGYLERNPQSLDERTATEANGVYKILGCKPGEKLLDCPCGYGRHSNYLCQKGLDVVGADINSVHLGRAVEAAKRRQLSTRFVKKNMIDIDYKNEFNYVINMFYSFGFFATDEENFRVLKNFYNALKPRGKFLMHTDVNVPRIISNRYKFDENRALDSGNNLRIIDEYDQETKRIEGRWIIRNAGGEEVERDYSVRVYTKEEFEQMCFDAGFSKVETYSEWTGDTYYEDSEDMIVVATK